APSTYGTVWPRSTPACWRSPVSTTRSPRRRTCKRSRTRSRTPGTRRWPTRRTRSRPSNRRSWPRWCENSSMVEICASPAEAVRGVADGSTVLIGGFGTAGMPFALLTALVEQGARDLTVVSNNAGNGDTGLAALLAAGQVRKIVCSFPRQPDSWVFDGLFRAGKIELELVPQGTLAERIRAGGAGIGGFYTRTGVGT